MKTMFICLCLSLSSCISYHIAEKDVFYPRSVARLHERLVLEDVYLTTSDSIHLNAWFVKHPHAEGTMLYFGGNGFSLWNRVSSDVINTLSGFNMNVLLIDYRGYGRSDGRSTLSGILEDGRTAYRYLCSRPDVDSTRIIIYGHSLGTFVATHLGSSVPVAGVILEGPLTNAPEMRDALLKTNAPWYVRWLVRVEIDSAVFALDNLAAIRRLSQPLLVLSGENDIVTPPEMGKKLSEAAPSANKRYVVIPKGEHSDLFFTNDGRRERYLQVVSEFVTSVTRRQ